MIYSLSSRKVESNMAQIKNIKNTIKIPPRTTSRGPR